MSRASCECTSVSGSRRQRDRHGGSVSELVSGSALVAGGLVVELLKPVGFGFVDRLEPPRARIGPFRLRALLVPSGLLRPDGLLAIDVAPEETLGFSELPTDVVPIDGDESDDGDDGDDSDESDEGDEGIETDEPAGDVGAQLTPGVITDDGVVGLVDVVPLVEVAPLVDVLELELVPAVEPVAVAVCANAGAALKAIAHARPAPLRIGIVMILIRILVKMFLLS